MVDDDVREVIALARRGDVAGAREVGERALAAGGNAPLLGALLGAICCQTGDFAAAIPYLRRAHDAHPEDITIAVNLVTALAQAGQSQGALGICSPARADADLSGRLRRLRAYLLQAVDDYAGAAAAYEKILKTASNDFESWNNLGNCRAALGDIDGSIEALGRAARLRPDSAPVRLNVATTLMEAGRFDEAETAFEAAARDFPHDAKPLIELTGLRKRQGRMEDALVALEQAAARDPGDPELQVNLAVERFGLWDMMGADAALSGALALVPAHDQAHIHRALLYEHTHRGDRIEALADEAEDAGVDPPAVALIRALALKRAERWRACLDTLDTVPEALGAARIAQLRGQCLDRLGEAEAAFEAFAHMNVLMAEDSSAPLTRAAETRQMLREQTALLTPDWVAGLPPLRAPASDRSPVFLVGFPRSGTTLLDTILMGHPDVEVMEEEPPLTHVDRAVGGLDRLASLSDDELDTMRAMYFREAAEATPLRPGMLLIDKSPLHMSKVPLLRRLLPASRFILALRHPCDVAISCFSTNFRLNNAMSNFLSLETTVEYYDLIFKNWERARQLLEPGVHEVRYERLVELVHLDAPAVRISRARLAGGGARPSDDRGGPRGHLDGELCTGHRAALPPLRRALDALSCAARSRSTGARALVRTLWLRALAHGPPRRARSGCRPCDGATRLRAGGSSARGVDPAEAGSGRRVDEAFGGAPRERARGGRSGSG